MLNVLLNLTIKGRQVVVMSAARASQHRDILTLAVLSEKSCEAVLKAVGRAVFSLFPTTMALEEKARVSSCEYSKDHAAFILLLILSFLPPHSNFSPPSTIP